MTGRFTELAIDCADPNGLARFWCSVFDYEVQDEDDGIVTIGFPTSAKAMRPGSYLPTQRRMILKDPSEPSQVTQRRYRITPTSALRNMAETHRLSLHLTR